MTWEETIIKIRKEDDYKILVEQAYLDENLELNVQRFSKSKEFEQTLMIIKSYQPNTSSILDIGCGNGISAINLALKGYNVTAVEPDKSKTVGAGAIKELKEAVLDEGVLSFEVEEKKMGSLEKVASSGKLRRVIDKREY